MATHYFSLTVLLGVWTTPTCWTTPYEVVTPQTFNDHCSRREEVVKNTKPCFHSADTVRRYKEEIKAQLSDLSDSKAYTACFNCIISHWRDAPSPKKPHLAMQSWHRCLQRRRSLCQQSSVAFSVGCSSPTPKAKTAWSRASIRWHVWNSFSPSLAPKLSQDKDYISASF